MALTSTIYQFEIDLTDSDRHVYESLSLRVAKHPSESDEYLVARLLAYCLEYCDGIAFSSGVSDADEPTLFARDLTGALTLWVEIGLPDAARLHKASKSAPRVAMYTHKDPTQWLRQIAGARIHRADAIHAIAFDRTLIASLAARLDRRMAMSISVADQHMLVAVGSETMEGALTPVGVAQES